MILTHDTTIEQYEAWLSTNPDFNSFKAAVRKTYRMIYRTIGKMCRIIKGRNRCSCTTGKRIGKTIYPLSYDKNSGFTIAKYQSWKRGIRHELALTTIYLEALALVECLHDVNVMEKLGTEALEIINQK